MPLLLGRPFLKTSKTKIDVHEGNLTMEFDGEVIKFNIFDAMRYPSDINNLCAIDTIDVIDMIAQHLFDTSKLFDELLNYDTDVKYVVDSNDSDASMAECSF